MPFIEETKIRAEEMRISFHNQIEDMIYTHERVYGCRAARELFDIISITISASDLRILQAGWPPRRPELTHFNDGWQFNGIPLITAEVAQPSIGCLDISKFNEILERYSV